MLQVIQISGDIFFTYEMHTSAAAYVLRKNASITTTNPDSLLQMNGVTNDLITIKGQIHGSTAYLDAGISLHGGDSRTVIAKSGLVEASTGIEAGSSGQVIENHGLVSANDRAIWLQSDGAVENYGRIYGHDYGIISGGISAVTIVNHKGGVIASDIVAVKVAGGYDTASVLENDGLITGKGGWAYMSAWGSETVINHGVMKGTIRMGEGDDTFDNRGGKVDHDILGQIGNDTLITDNANVHLAEELGEGIDTVRSTVTYTLSDNVENLFLLGGRDINGKGTDVENMLVGNKGDNTLKGLAGNDLLDGGRGNDILAGGTEADIFVLVKHGGRDVVTDFAFGEDKVNLASQGVIDDFMDLVSNHVRASHGDLIIELGGKDMLVLEDTNLNDLSTANFMF
jgi:Ca2+-binding RTX toxin-like protein